MASFSWAGKVALVTGGSGGLGQAMALASAGAQVAVAGRSGEGVSEVVKEIEAVGRSGLAVIGDVAVPNKARRVVRAVVQEFSRLDVLVNAAGVNRRIPSLEVKEEEMGLDPRG